MLCSNGYGYGDGHGFRNGDGHGKGLKGGSGGGYGTGYGYKYGDGNGGGMGRPYHPNKYDLLKAVSEGPACTRLLSDDYPDINFYMCQMQLMRGK